MISVMNGRRVGGGFLMAPDAKDDDGLFDLCIAQQVSRPAILATIPLFFSGTQFKKSTITGGRTRKISVEALEGSLPVQADGEIICMAGKRVDVEIHAKAINLVCTV
jgi:diacylglycerol kinase family enzyme